MAVLGVISAVLMVMGLWHAFIKPLPQGISMAGPMRQAHGVKFLHDLTYIDSQGQRQSRQEIFDHAFGMIQAARQFILIDMFLFNDFKGQMPSVHRVLSAQLTDALIAQKSAHPDMEIHFITDPINTVYGGMDSTHLARLRAAGVHVTTTDLDKLRDSNVLYSTLWRTFLRPLGNGQGTAMASPFGQGRVSIRSYLKLLNFKANHRKVIIADSEGGGLSAMVTSANPHDASSAHTNVALAFSGQVVVDMLESERAVLEFSGGDKIKYAPGAVQQAGDALSIRVLTESKIRAAVVDALSKSERGHRVSLAMFYLSDRDVIAALKAAHRRGAEVRVLLDPNKDSFGRTRGGVPNRQVALELDAEGVPVRWCDTHGEQCHFKMLLVQGQSGLCTMFLGSANFTSRNLEDFNLETDVELIGPSTSKPFADAMGMFELAWGNGPGVRVSVPYETYRDPSKFKVLMYRAMEFTGVSTF